MKVEVLISRIIFLEFCFNKATLDIDTKDTSESRRVEWVHLRYHSFYDPGQAYEIDLDWMVVTSNVIADTVRDWYRKAVSNNLHLVPIPSDPFALPFAGKSDPLRGPIYIEINLESLKDQKHPVRGKVGILKGDELVKFREKILTKWGFLPFLEPGHENKKQYVHVSGSIFVMIPGKEGSKSADLTSTAIGKRVSTCSSSQEGDLHEDYITKHFSGYKPSDDKHNKVLKVGS